MVAQNSICSDPPPVSHPLLTARLVTPFWKRGPAEGCLLPPESSPMLSPGPGGAEAVTATTRTTEIPVEAGLG